MIGYRERESDLSSDYLVTGQETEIRFPEILTGQKSGTDLMRDLLNYEVIGLEREGRAPS